MSDLVREKGRKDDFHDWAKKNKNFPCSCGDWRGNETRPFMKKIGFEWAGGNPRPLLAEELFDKTCPMAKILSRFLLILVREVNTIIATSSTSTGHPFYGFLSTWH